jgi:DNA-binding NtrC family response regulator
MKILIAEDDQDQLLVRSMLLRQSGFEPIEANDISSAVHSAEVHRPECAVIDLRFPTEELGLKLIRELKALDSALHVFVLTGGDPTGLARHAERDLVEEIVVKGSSTPDLIRKLKAVAARSCG